MQNVPGRVRFIRAIAARKQLAVFVVGLCFAVAGLFFLVASRMATVSVGSGVKAGQTGSAAGSVNGSGTSEGAAALLGNGNGSAGGGVNLDDPAKKEIAMELVSSAENSSLGWKAQYAYIEDIGDGRGYTAGIIGFCSGTGDMLTLVRNYTQASPHNVLAKYLPALQQVNGTASHTGLGTAFVRDWKTAAADPLFQQAQNNERDAVYFTPSVNQAKADGLHALGQFIYYDAIVMHGPGSDSSSFGGLRAGVVQKTKPPSQGGDETVYLNAFLDARKTLMLTEAAHDNTSRVDTEQRTFLNNGNLDLHLPLTWMTYGDTYSITANPTP